MTFDIDDLIASHQPTGTQAPEPQHADHEAFQRMGLFGARRKKAPAPEPTPVRPMPKPVMAGAAPETDEQRQAREADEAAFQAAKEAQPPIDNPSEGQQ